MPPIENTLTSETALKAQLNQLFRLLEVQRIVIVDDEFQVEPKPEQVKSLLEQLETQGNTEAILRIGIEAELPIEIKRERLLEIWENRTREERVDLLHEMSLAAGVAATLNIEDDIHLIFRDLEPEYKPLRPSAWNLQRNALILDANNGLKTLFLFDQDQSNDGESPTAGTTQLAGIVVECNKEAALCGLLSHTFNADSEHDTWLKLTTDLNFDPEQSNRVVPIAKERLRNDASELVRRLRLTGLLSFSAELKTHANAVLKSAQEKAYTALDDLTIFDFEHVVFTSSENEGVWEVDTLFRLYGVHHRHTAKELAYENANLQETTNKLRQLRTIVDDTKKPTSPAAASLRRLELYEESQLNTTHTPLDLGDIFLDHENTYHILIAAPCDLMLRNEGTRGLKEGILVPIRVVRSKDQKVNANQRESFFFLPLFLKSEPQIECFAEFKFARTVSLNILDLSVFQADGSAKISLQDEQPPGLLAGWHNRFEHLLKTYKGELAYLTSFQPETMAQSLSKEFLGKLLPPVSLDGYFQTVVSLDEKKIEYNLKRVARLQGAQAYAMLMAYTRFMSRPAFEHDFLNPK
jgi:hypothetical protein